MLVPELGENHRTHLAHNSENAKKEEHRVDRFDTFFEDYSKRECQVDCV